MNETIQATDPAMQLPDGNVRNPGDFPEEQFELIENVPVFAEHETTSKSGQEIKFTYNELKAVADRSNRRIAESGDYAAISIGHTPSPEAKAAGASDPDVVGFAGPFRIGRLGQADQRQRFAILADFHVFKEDLGRFRKHPRRSPELWLEDCYEEMFLDPIALLGAEAPRLDLGLLYSASRHGIEIEKYAAASPGPMNAFVPSHGDEDDSLVTYSSDTGENQMSQLTGDDLQQIVDALEQTEWVQWVKSQMAADTPAGDGGGEIGTEAPAMEAADAPGGMEPPAAPPMAPEAPPMDAAPPAPPMAPEAPPMDAAPPVPPEAPEGPPEERQKAYAAMDDLDDDEIEQYMANRYGAENATGEYQNAQKPEGPGCSQYMAEGSADGTSKNPSAEGTTDGSDTLADGDADDQDQGSRVAESYSRNGDRMQYQRLQGHVRSLEDKMKGMQEKLQYERGARVDAERYQRLQDLHFVQGLQFDLDTEHERLKYAKASDEQFESSIESLQRNCQRMPMHGLPYTPEGSIFSEDRPGGGAERAKYSKGQSEEAMRICQRMVDNGEQPVYEEILEQVANGQAH